MTPTEFKTHLTDVTDEIITAYFHRINTAFSIFDNQSYQANICHYLLIKNNLMDQTVSNDNDDDLKKELSQFKLKDPQNLKDYCKDFFQDQIIYQVDDQMTKWICNYFQDLKLNLINQFNGSVLYDRQIQSNLYFAGDPKHLDYDINMSLFGGNIFSAESFDRFLSTIN